MARKPATKKTTEMTETNASMEAAAASAAASNQELLEKLRAEAIKARDALTETYENSAPEMRERWLAYGQVLLRIRERIPSRADFGRFIEINDLDKIGGEATEKNVRTAAMKWASLTDDERAFLEARHPAVYNPRTLAIKYQEAMKATLIAIHEAVADGEIAEDAFKLPRKEDDRNEAAENARISVLDTLEEWRKAARENKDTVRARHLDDVFAFTQAVHPLRLTQDFAKFDYEKATKEKKDGKFEHLTVAEAVAKILRMLEKHPQGPAILEKLTEAHRDSADDEEDESEGEDQYEEDFDDEDEED